MMWKLSTQLYNQVLIYDFSENHPAFKTNRSSGVAPISINPARHTSKANASGGEEDIIGSYIPGRKNTIVTTVV